MVVVAVVGKEEVYGLPRVEGLIDIKRYCIVLLNLP